MANVVAGIDIDALLGGDQFTNMAPTGSGQYIEPGDYLFKVVTCEIKNGHKGTTFIGTNEVVSVMRTNETGLTPGAQRNIVEVLTGKNGKIMQGNMKAYLLAACESLYQRKIPVTGVNPGFVARVLQPDQPLKGVYVLCQAFHKAKANGTAGVVTIKNWKMITNEELAPLGLSQPKPIE